MVADFDSTLICDTFWKQWPLHYSDAMLWPNETIGPSPFTIPTPCCSQTKQYVATQPRQKNNRSKPSVCAYTQCVCLVRSGWKSKGQPQACVNAHNVPLSHLRPSWETEDTNTKRAGNHMAGMGNHGNRFILNKIIHSLLIF